MKRRLPGCAGVLRLRAETLFTTVDTKESISLPESHADLWITGLGNIRPSSSVSLSLLVGGRFDSSLSGGASTLTCLLNTPIIVTSCISSVHVIGWVKVRLMLLFRCFTFIEPSERDLLPLNLNSILLSPLVLFRSDGESDFFLECRRLLARFCLLDSRVVCIVDALGRSARGETQGI